VDPGQRLVNIIVARFRWQKLSPRGGDDTCKLNLALFARTTKELRT
jgi:hypothetical protein